MRWILLTLLIIIAGQVIQTSGRPSNVDRTEEQDRGTSNTMPEQSNEASEEPLVDDPYEKIRSSEENAREEEAMEEYGNMSEESVQENPDELATDQPFTEDKKEEAIDGSSEMQSSSDNETELEENSNDNSDQTVAEKIMKDEPQENDSANTKNKETPASEQEAKQTVGKISKEVDDDQPKKQMSPENVDELNLDENKVTNEKKEPGHENVEGPENEQTTTEVADGNDVISNAELKVTANYDVEPTQQGDNANDKTDEEVLSEAQEDVQEDELSENTSNKELTAVHSEVPVEADSNDIVENDATEVSNGESIVTALPSTTAPQDTVANQDRPITAKPYDNQNQTNVISKVSDSRELDDLAKDEEATITPVHNHVTNNYESESKEGASTEANEITTKITEPTMILSMHSEPETTETPMNKSQSNEQKLTGVHNTVDKQHEINNPIAGKLVHSAAEDRTTHSIQNEIADSTTPFMTTESTLNDDLEEEIVSHSSELPDSTENPHMNAFEFDMPIFNESLHRELMMNESDWLKEFTTLSNMADDFVIHDACEFIRDKIQHMFGIKVTKEQVHNTLPMLHFLLSADTESLTTTKDMLLSCVKATNKVDDNENEACQQIKFLIKQACKAIPNCHEEEMMKQTLQHIREAINNDQLADAFLMLRACAAQSYD